MSRAAELPGARVRPLKQRHAVSEAALLVCKRRFGSREIGATSADDVIRKTGAGLWRQVELLRIAYARAEALTRDPAWPTFRRSLM